MTTGLATGTYELFVGIDIAATTAEVATQRPGAKARKSFKIDQTPEGFNRLVKKLQATGHDPSHILVVMEATGSYPYNATCVKWIQLRYHRDSFPYQKWRKMKEK